MFSEINPFPFWQALCVNSIHQGQAAVASNRKVSPTIFTLDYLAYWYDLKFSVFFFFIAFLFLLTCKLY